MSEAAKNLVEQKVKPKKKKNLYEYCFKAIIPIFITIATLAIYMQVKNFEAITRDDQQIEYLIKNYDLAKHPFDLILNQPTSPPYPSPIPILTGIIFRIILGKNIQDFRLASVVFHLATAISIFFLLYLSSHQRWQSAFAASLFAFHPINSGSIALFSFGLGTTISGFFTIICLISYIYYTIRPNIIRYSLFVFMLLLAILAKPTMLIIIIILPLLDYWPIGRISFKNFHITFVKDRGKTLTNNWKLSVLSEKIPIVILSSVLFLLTLWYYNSTTNSLQQKLDIVSMLIYIPISCITYIWKIIYPLGLPSYISPLYAGSLPVGLSFCSISLIFLITFISLYLARSHPYLLVGWFWFLCCILPHTIIVVSDKKLTIIERYAYIPAIGLYILIAWGGGYILTNIKIKKILITTFSVVYLFALMSISWSTTKHWGNSLNYWRHATTIYPENSEAHLAFGKALMDKGYLDEAIKQFKIALKLNPHNVISLSFLANVFILKNDIKQAVFYYRKALQMNSDYIAAHNDLANLLLKLGEIDQAIYHYKKALEISTKKNVPPNMIAIAHNNLATALIYKGDLKQALTHLKTALSINPSYQTAKKNMTLIEKINGRQQAPR